MLKRKQLQEQQESERRQLGLEREDFECFSSDSDSEEDARENSESFDKYSDMVDADDSEDDEKRIGTTKTKVMILGSRGINSR